MVAVWGIKTRLGTTVARESPALQCNSSSPDKLTMTCHMLCGHPGVEQPTGAGEANVCLSPLHQASELRGKGEADYLEAARGPRLLITDTHYCSTLVCAK